MLLSNLINPMLSKFNIVFFVTYFLYKTLVGFGETGHGVIVRVLDVGQGDSILITTPNNKYVLIDGGPNYDSDRLLAKFMPPFSRCRLALVIVTHPHADHLYGLNKIIRRCSVDLVAYSDVAYKSTIFDSFKSLVKKIPYRQLVAGDKFGVGGVDFYVLWPAAAVLNNPPANMNNISTVIFMDYKKFEGFFTGDAEYPVLSQLDTPYILPKIDGGLDLYKTAHHGSSNGLERSLTTSLNPINCVISAGKDNSFGHPHRLVLDFLAKINCKTIRTDQSGTYELRTNY